ncbi:LuxR family transcriptional regulator, partial [Escherichia coli]|nr:LuxR family transcriptional regulator [Escherichia coli]EGO8987959.1 LuxR family transcriptional regulator [Escherichia coli]
LCVSSQRYCNCLRISKGRLHYANAASDGWLS